MAREPWDIQKYQEENGTIPFDEWLATLDNKSQTRVDLRLRKVAAGNFGDCKPLGKGLYELRFFFGPGYRVYYAVSGKRIILLLAGGDKKRQSKSIKAARKLWQRYQDSREG